MSYEQITLERFSAIREWDIDLLLLEELHCNSHFVRWFFESVRQRSKRFVLPSLTDPVCISRHSVNYLGDGSGESDIEATFHGIENGAACQVLMLIEDKIDARFTEMQPERYFNRCAEICLARGVLGAIVLVAPQDYLMAVATTSFDAQISYEEIGQQLSASQAGDNAELTARRQHRALMIQHAIARYRRAGNRVNDDNRTRFFDDYFQLAQSRHPQLRQKPVRKRSVASRGFFFELYPRVSKGIDELYMEHGLDRGFVSIVFRGWGKRSDYYLSRCTGAITDRRMVVDAPPDRQFVQVRIAGLPHLEFDKPILDQLPAALIGIDAAAALLAWYQEHVTDFEEWVDQIA
ncbi:MAG TPA: hypothetical protein VMM76_12630 [Pirellulaceae bacterium]|nr:hypothetical protein [Pirellulaceae bacterium]